MRRVAFIVDGFNVYHSLKDAEAKSGQNLKWLDLRKLLTSYLPAIGGAASMGSVHYFSALARHINRPDVVTRHQTYIKALRTTGVDVHLGRFKRSMTYCKNCRKPFERWEEKESDVALSMKALEVLHGGQADVCALVTGDTDVLPAIGTARSMYPGVEFHVFFPYRRKNKELAKAADQSYQIKVQRYAACQLPDPVLSPSGTIAKPSSW